MPIDKDTAVISLKSIDQQFFANSIIDILLMSIRGKDFIKGKGMFFDLDFVRCIDDSFIIVTGFDSNKYLDGILW